MYIHIAGSKQFGRFIFNHKNVVGKRLFETMNRCYRHSSVLNQGFGKTVCNKIYASSFAYCKSNIVIDTNSFLKHSMIYKIYLKL